MKNLFVPMLFAFILVLSGCSPRYSVFNTALYQSNNFSDDQLKKIQFYLSEDLLLYRDLEELGNVKIDEGSIKIKNGRKVEEIIIRSGTPGVFVSRPTSDHFAISFDPQSNAKYLMFGPNPKRDGRYQLLASEWKNRSATVTYDGRKFQTISDRVPELLVNLKKSGMVKVDKSVARGRKVE